MRYTKYTYQAAQCSARAAIPYRVSLIYKVHLYSLFLSLIPHIKQININPESPVCRLSRPWSAMKSMDLYRPVQCVRKVCWVLYTWTISRSLSCDKTGNRGQGKGTRTRHGHTQHSVILSSPIHRNKIIYSA